METDSTQVPSGKDEKHPSSKWFSLLRPHAPKGVKREWNRLIATLCFWQRLKTLNPYYCFLRSTIGQMYLRSLICGGLLGDSCRGLTWVYTSLRLQCSHYTYAHWSHWQTQHVLLLWVFDFGHWRKRYQLFDPSWNTDQGVQLNCES